MKKRALLLHGFHSTSASYFLPHTFAALEVKGYEVIAKSLPSPDEPSLQCWTDALLPELIAVDHAVDLVVAHSLGGCFALQLLSQKLLRTQCLVLIGASFGPKNSDPLNSFVIPPFDLERIKVQAPRIYSVFSYDDPWTLPEYGALLIKQLRATGLVYSDQGHFEVDELPCDLLKLIE